MPLMILLKQMLPGLLPLFVFILVDEIWGTTVGLITALALGLTELVFTRIREKRYDGFVLLDTGFLLILGLVSLVSDNAIFFKLKPALLEFIICMMFASAAVNPGMFLKAMTSRYMKNMTLTVTGDAISRMRRMMIILTAAFLLHTGLVVYSAFRMSDRAWGFISGGLFYILFGAILGGQLLAARLRTANKT